MDNDSEPKRESGEDKALGDQEEMNAASSVAAAYP